MKSIIFSAILYTNCIFAQTCSLNFKGYSFHNTFVLEIQNNNQKTVKIPKSIYPIYFQIKEIERFDSLENVYRSIIIKPKDINCPQCNGKSIKLKWNQYYVYRTKISDIFLFSDIKEKGCYRFKIFLTVLEFPKDCDLFVSDWVTFEID